MTGAGFPGLRHPRWTRAEMVFWLLPVLAFFVFPHHLPLGSQILIAALFVLSFDLILGYAGIISLGHAAFFGLGAYTAGLLARHGWGEPLSGLLIAAAVAACVGWLTSFLVVRGQDLTRLMVTLGIALMLGEAANRLPGITGGADGLLGVQMWKLLGLFEFDLYGRTAYLYALAVLFALFWLARRLVHSPLGLSLRGIRENAQRMPAIGAPVTQRLSAVYTISAAYAGVAGALLTQTTQFVGLEVFSFPRSAELLIMITLGGVGQLYGGPLGAAIFMIAREAFADVNPQYWQFWLGVLLVAMVLFWRGGVLGAFALLRSRLAERLK